MNGISPLPQRLLETSLETLPYIIHTCDGLITLSAVNKNH